MGVSLWSLASQRPPSWRNPCSSFAHSARQSVGERFLSLAFQHWKGFSYEHAQQSTLAAAPNDGNLAVKCRVLLRVIDEIKMRIGRRQLKHGQSIEAVPNDCAKLNVLGGIKPVYVYKPVNESNARAVIVIECVAIPNVIKLT